TTWSPSTRYVIPLGGAPRVASTNCCTLLRSLWRTKPNSESSVASNGAGKSDSPCLRSETNLDIAPFEGTCSVLIPRHHPTVCRIVWRAESKIESNIPGGRAECDCSSLSKEIELDNGVFTMDVFLLP